MRTWVSKVLSKGSYLDFDRLERSLERSLETVRKLPQVETFMHLSFGTFDDPSTITRQSSILGRRGREEGLPEACRTSVQIDRSQPVHTHRAFCYLH